MLLIVEERSERKECLCVRESERERKCAPNNRGCVPATATC